MDTNNSNITDIEQLNSLLILLSKTSAEKSANYRAVLKERYKLGLHTTDIVPPFCFENSSLQKNIENVMSGYQNTLMAAIFAEAQQVKTMFDFKALQSVINGEKSMIFDFLDEKGLTGEFTNYVALKKMSLKNEFKNLDL